MKISNTTTKIYITTYSTISREIRTKQLPILEPKKHTIDNIDSKKQPNNNTTQMATIKSIFISTKNPGEILYMR